MHWDILFYLLCWQIIASEGNLALMVIATAQCTQTLRAGRWRSTGETQIVFRKEQGLASGMIWEGGKGETARGKGELTRPVIAARRP